MSDRKPSARSAKRRSSDDFGGQSGELKRLAVFVYLFVIHRKNIANFFDTPYWPSRRYPPDAAKRRDFVGHMTNMGTNVDTPTQPAERLKTAGTGAVMLGDTNTPTQCQVAAMIANRLTIEASGEMALHRTADVVATCAAKSPRHRTSCGPPNTVLLLPNRKADKPRRPLPKAPT